MPICDKCESRIPEDAKFCPQCADPVTEADYSKQPTTRSTVPQISIEFGHSTSSRFDEAVELAQRLPTHTSDGEGTDVVHQVQLEATDVGLAVSLWEIVGNWKSARMTVDGERITKKDLTYGALGCYQNRQESFEPQEYCYGEREHDQNIWGCHNLGLPLSPWRESWFTWGEWNAKGEWHWDKDRIRHELEKALHDFRYCPVLDRDAVMATLERLPNGIDPERNSGWNYVTDWQDGSEVPVGVCPTLGTAKKLAAGSHTPEWQSNSGLERASSELQDLSTGYEVTTQFAQKQQKSGCLGLLLAGLALPMVVLLL